MVTIAATLLSGQPPQSVQVVLGGLDPGAVYVVRGSAGGQTWSVPGGEGATVDGGQQILIDPIAPFNIPVTYTAVVDGVTVVSAPVTVPFTGRGCAVLTSLSGLERLEVAWVDNGLPDELEIHSASYPVPGRRRRPGRYAPTGDGGGTIQVLVSSADRAAWKALMRPGQILATRTDGALADWPPVELIRVIAAGTVLRPLAGDKTARLATIEHELAELPDPTVVIVAYTWDDFDEVYAESTWDEFDDEWAASTWDAFDRFDWGQRL